MSVHTKFMIVSVAVIAERFVGAAGNDGIGSRALKSKNRPLPDRENARRLRRRLAAPGRRARQGAHMQADASAARELARSRYSFEAGRELMKAALTQADAVSSEEGISLYSV